MEREEWEVWGAGRDCWLLESWWPWPVRAEAALRRASIAVVVVLLVSLVVMMVRVMV